MAKTDPNEFKKLISTYLKPKAGKVEEIHIPRFKYIMVDGEGEPASEAYSAAIQGLYNHAYTIKFLPKSGAAVAGYEPFSVASLQGLYGKFEDGWKWTLMIAVPDFINHDTIAQAREEMKRKGKAVNEAVQLKDWEEGDVLQTLHVGPYDKEQPTIDILQSYAKEHGYTLVGRQDEIYMNDPRRVAPDKIKVIIRYQVKR